MNTRTTNTPSGTTRSIRGADGAARRATARGPLSRRMLSLVLATTACTAGIALQAPARAMADDTLCGDTTAGMNLGVGADTYISESVDQTAMKDDALAGVISWRKDALNSTARLWDGMTVKDYLAQHGISQDTYLHPQWNRDLERIAIQRAAETNVSWSHTRPNGQAWNSVTTTSGTRSAAEVLSTRSMPDALDDWAGEKQQVLDHPDADNSSTAAHYLFLIDPHHLGYGFADANRNAGVGETSDSPATDQGTTGWQAVCSFHVPTLAKDLTGRLSPAVAAVGQVKQLRASATGTWPGWFNAQQQSTFQLRGTFTTDDADVASVDDGFLTARSIGSTNVSITSGDQKLPLGEFSVNGRQITTVTNPETITTASGHQPLMPSTVTATWNDGETSEELVTWDVLPATWKNRAGGKFSVNGTVHGWNSPVKATIVVTPATFVGVQDVAVDTVVGVAPKLPATVPGTWSNGDTTRQPVTWDTPSASSYAQPGSFTVAGRATAPDGRILAVTATVAVQQFVAPVGTMPRATGLLGEATGDRFADVWGIDAAGTLDFHRSTATGLVKVGVRGQQLQDVSYLAPVEDENADHRADVLYRTKSDGSLWLGHNLGNGYLQPGVQVGSHWNVMDQIFYAGHMVAGSSTQYVLARRADNGTLWRYVLTPKGLSNGVQVGHGWGGMRVMMSPGNMWGDSAWDVVAIAQDGTMYGYRTHGGALQSMGQVGHGWSSTVSAFVPGDLTGDGRLDMMGVRTDGSVWAYANTARGWVGLGRRATGFHYTVLG